MIYKKMIDGMTGLESTLGIKKIENEKEIIIPFDPANTSYQEYLKWVAEGNEPEPAE